MHFVSQRFHFLNANRRQPVDSDPAVTAAMFPNNGVHLNGPFLGPLGDMLAGGHIKERYGLNGVINAGQTLRQEVLATVLKN